MWWPFGGFVYINILTISLDPARGRRDFRTEGHFGPLGQKGVFLPKTPKVAHAITPSYDGGGGTSYATTHCPFGGTYT